MRINKIVKIIITAVLAIIMAAAVLPTSERAYAAETPTPYNGTPVTPQQISSGNYKLLGLTDDNWSQYNGYYAIRDASELYGFMNMCSSTTDINAVLLNDIVVNTSVSSSGATYSWTPLGGLGSSVNNRYKGTFDGNGHYISGLYASYSDGHYIAFISRMYGTVKNLVIKNSYFSGYDFASAVCGYSQGTIENCRVESSVSVYGKDQPVGGICARGYGTIKNCVSFATVKSDFYNVGAIVGQRGDDCTLINNYYLAESAKNKNNKAQNGVGINSLDRTEPDVAGECTSLASESASHTCVSVTHNEVKATCDYPGVSQYSYCLVCGNVTGGTKVVTEPTGHDFAAATCDTPKKCSKCGKTEGDALGHDWVYTANGGRIVATCENDANHKATATISTDAQEYVYTGSPMTPASIAYSDNWEGEKKENSEIVYSGNTNAGTATASVTLEGKTITASFKINKADLSSAAVTITPEESVYNGSKQEPAVSVSASGFGELTEGVHYIKIWEDNDFTDVSVCAVLISGIGNFEGDIVQVYSIKPAEITNISVKQEGELTYDGGEPLTPGVTATAETVNDQPVTFTYCLIEDGSYGSMPCFTEAGTYTVWYKATAPQHEDAVGSFEVKISPKKVYLDWGATHFIPYTGEDKMPVPVVPDDAFTVTTKWVETDEGVGVIPGYWHAAVDTVSTTNYEILNPTVEIYIMNGFQDKPEVSFAAETVKGRADGSITDVDETMEYRAEGEEEYTAVSGSEIGNLSAGKYYVRYKEKQYYNASPYVEVDIAEGNMLKVELPEQVGFELKAEHSELAWHGETTLTFKLLDGYAKTDDFAVTVTGAELKDNGDGTYTVSEAEDDVVISVAGVEDVTPPKAVITLKDNWNKFWNGITFGTFFNETQTFTVKAEDKESGVDKVYYYLADKELSESEVAALTQWTEYTAPVKVDPDKVFAIYVKATDKAGNVFFANSDGFVLDGTKPMLYGIENGGVYYEDKTFRVVDEYLLSLVVDGKDVTDTLEGDMDYKIEADNKEHTVKATDKAGNVTEYKITVYKTYTVTFKDEDGVYKTVKVKHGEKVELPEPPEKDGYTVKWETVPDAVTGDLTVKAVYTENSAAGPSTGEGIALLFWTAVAVVSGGALIFMIKKRAKHN